MTRTTIGIDLASQPKNTGVCAIAWNLAGSGAGEVVETSANAGASDEDLRLLLDRADSRVGIDVPLGWPTRFSDSVATYSRGGKWTVRHGDCRLRATDIWLTEELTRRGLRRTVPLSVAADLIAMPAMRAAHLLSAAGLEAMPRDGSARIVEVYPAAALEAWRLPSRGYKGKENVDARRQLLSIIFDRLAGHLTIDDEHRARLEVIDHAFDAFIAALVVGCHERGLTTPIPPELRAMARIEGCILLPVEGSLDRLAGQ
jgi:predicted RNase H-like nuclease